MKSKPAPLSGAIPATPDSKPPAGKVSPELVRQLADRVYAMLLLDANIAQERYRNQPGASRPERFGS